MHPRRLASLSLYVGLTLAFGIVAHMVVEQLGARGGVFILINPMHAGLATAALLALVAALSPLGLGRPRPERRRRTALFAAALPGAAQGVALVFAAVLAQTFVAAGTLAVEGVPFEPSRLGVAIVCGLLSVLFGAAVTRTLQTRVVRLFAVFAHVAALRAAGTHAGPRARAFRPAVRVRLYELFIPNRPPPALVSIPLLP